LSQSALVSIVLVNHDCGALVDFALGSLVAQDYPHLEILIVDNASTDGSCDTIARNYPNVTILKLERNAGFSGGLNAGIRRSAGEFVLSLNFDVVLEPDFISALVDALRRRPDAGWAAGQLRRLTWDGITDSIDCNGHYWLRSRYCYGYDPAHPNVDHYSAEQDVFGASACAAMYRRRMLDELAIDGEIFDEDLFAYFEDVDLDWRAQQRGYRCVFVPNARGAHMRGGTGASRRPEVAALILANRFLVMVKNDDLSHVVKDLSPITRRTAVDVAIHLRDMPSAVPAGFFRVIRLLPRMLAKRRRIRRARVSSPSYIRSLQVKSDFLG
jgi:GT2 family glycosyltransferase